MAGATSLRELATGVDDAMRAQRIYREDYWTRTQEQAEALRRRDVDTKTVLPLRERTLQPQAVRGWITAIHLPTYANAVWHWLTVTV